MKWNISSSRAEIFYQSSGSVLGQLKMVKTERMLRMSCFCLSPGYQTPLRCGGSGTASCSRLPMWQGWAGTENRGVTFVNRWNGFSPCSCSVLIGGYPLLPWTDALGPDNLLISCILKGARHGLSWIYEMMHFFLSLHLEPSRHPLKSLIT